MERNVPSSPALPGPSIPLEDLFPQTDYRHRLKVVRVDPAAFFGARDKTGALVAERRHWLGQAPERHDVALAEAAPLLRETSALFRAWGILPSSAPSGPATEVEVTRIPEELALCEPDQIWLTRGSGQARMVAGCVCFPSSWAPETRLGLPLREIHDIVPDLNESLGASIDRFLERLPPGSAWLRANWGLSPSPEGNRHPARQLPQLCVPLDPERVWVRIEHQALVALPETNGILFGIRIESIPLGDFRASPVLGAGLARALHTLSEDMARYKGLAETRKALIALLL